MTSLVVWVGHHSRAPASVYIATDSRISWSPSQVWDGGLKTFASAQFPDVFGYVGDVLAPSTIISQFRQVLDLGAYGQPDFETRSELLISLAKDRFSALPKENRRPFTLVHASRTTDSPPQFAVRVSEFAEGKATTITLPQPTKSAELLILGSGAGDLNRHLSRWHNSDVGRTSRAVFSAFCDSIRASSDPRSGGAAQLVGIWGTGPGRTFGVHSTGTAFVGGARVANPEDAPDLPWFNELFERCSPSGDRIGQRQPRPAEHRC